MRSDKELVRNVFAESCTRGDKHYHLRAILTRFGGFSVMVFDDDLNTVWQGDNILEARDWLDSFE